MEPPKGMDDGEIPEAIRRQVFRVLLPPTGPVLSGSGAVLVALLLPALVPGLSALVGPILLLLAIRHLRRGRRLPWDRAVGRIGFFVGLFSLVTNGVALYHLERSGWRLDSLHEFLVGKQTLLVQIVWIASLVVSIILHECAHGAAARISGDPTAEEAGRLTLNPVPHIDPMGSVVLPAAMIYLKTGFVFGWAKPVPVNPYRFRRPRRGAAFVSVAGIATNVLLALLGAGLLLLTGAVLIGFFPEARITGFTQTFVPVRIEGIAGAQVWAGWIEALRALIVINMLLATLNLLPIPPLDGSQLLRTVLPDAWGRALMRLSGAGMIILIVLLYTGKLWAVFRPAILIGADLGALPGLILGLR